MSEETGSTRPLKPGVDASRTDLATRALVVEGAEGDGGEEDGDVEEDGRGHVLEQGLVAANYP